VGRAGVAALELRRQRPRPDARLAPAATPWADTGLGGNFFTVLRLTGRSYFDLGEPGRTVLATRASIGSEPALSIGGIPPDKLFYAGGGGSVRGFGFQALGPRDIQPNPAFDPADPEEEDPPTISVPLGGRSLAEFALEGRYRFGNYGVVAFVDAGQVYEAEYPTFSSMRFGVGIGGRVYTNFGPVRLDVATPIGRRQGEALISVYVSIGQAF
jgi:translocation and assembly module TamA